jgi:predicted outer membrane repeat protein
LFSQTTIYVNQNVQGGLQDGSSWNDAFPDLQQALAVSMDGDEIWVAAGTYFPSDSTDRSISFELKNGVRLLGGFIGTELDAEQRDPVLYPTRLSGNIGDSTIQTDNSYHVLRGRGLDESTVLDGFVISDGFSVGSVNLNSDSNGAGLYLVGSSALTNSRPLISNCRFEYNQAGGSGGAISASFVDSDDPFMSQNFVNPVVLHCTFDHNKADLYGGAIFKEGPTGGNDSFLVKDSKFTQCLRKLPTALFFGTGIALMENKGFLPSIRRVQYIITK